MVLLERDSELDEIAVRANALRALNGAGVPFLITGAYALFEHTGMSRRTKDLDIALRKRHLRRALSALEQAGFRTEVPDPAWIGKGHYGAQFVDLIFSSGNGLSAVDDLWFEHAKPSSLFGEPCLIAPVEELVWSKGFVNERDRYDGADVNHLIYACGRTLDWARLLARFEPHWEVLFAHVILYRFAFPDARSRVPDWVVIELCRRTQADLESGDADAHVCRGGLISRVQYQTDYELQGFESAVPSLRAAPNQNGVATQHGATPPKRKRLRREGRSTLSRRRRPVEKATE